MFGIKLREIAIFSAGILVANVLGPALSETTKHYWKKLPWLVDSVSVEHCLPLTASIHTLKRPDGEILGTAPANWFNPTSLVIANRSWNDFDNVRITAAYFDPSGQQVSRLRYRVLSSSFSYSDEYSVSSSGNGIRVDIPQLLREDIAIIESDFAGPVTALLGISSTSFETSKTVLPPSCSSEFVESTPISMVAAEDTEDCSWEKHQRACSTKPSSIEFEVTEGMAGSELINEFVIEWAE